MKKKILIFIILVVTLFSSCNNIKNEAEGKKEVKQLNSRQKIICKELELPTEYDKLNEDQKRTIMRIEELLEYLEDKYEIEFVYIGYSDGGILEEEWLEAYPINLNELYSVKLYVDDKQNKKDNYPEVIASIILSNDLEENFQKQFGNLFKVYCSSCEVFSKELASDISDLMGNVRCTFTIIVKGKNRQEDIRKYAQELVQWYKEKSIYGFSNFIMVDEDYFQKVTYENYSKAKIENDTEISLSCDIDSKGKIKIY